MFSSERDLLRPVRPEDFLLCIGSFSHSCDGHDWRCKQPSKMGQATRTRGLGSQTTVLLSLATYCCASRAKGIRRISNSSCRRSLVVQCGQNQPAWCTELLLASPLERTETRVFRQGETQMREQTDTYEAADTEMDASTNRLTVLQAVPLRCFRREEQKLTTSITEHCERMKCPVADRHRLLATEWRVGTKTGSRAAVETLNGMFS